MRNDLLFPRGRSRDFIRTLYPQTIGKLRLKIFQCPNKIFFKMAIFLAIRFQLADKMFRQIYLMHSIFRI